METEGEFFNPDLDKVTIGEINLVALGRAYKAISSFFSMSMSPEWECTPSLRSDFESYLFSTGNGAVERQLALRMVFEQTMSMSDRIDLVETKFGLHLFDDRAEKEAYLQQRRNTLTALLHPNH